MRTLLAGDNEGLCSAVGEDDTDCSGEIEGDRDSCGVGLGDSCAGALAAKTRQQRKAQTLKWRFVIRVLSIVAPVYVRKNVVAPFAVAQKFFIEIIRDKLIVQTIEAGKVIDGALSCVFPRGARFYEESPIT